MPNAKVIPGVVPGPSVSFTFDGMAFSGHEGEGIAAALMRAGFKGTRVSARREEARAYYCGMGACWDCIVEVAGEGFVKGCQYPLRAGLVVRSATIRRDEETSA
jgi:predicted molibdopterin-dependent oxidoreductase YjgC